MYSINASSSKSLISNTPFNTDSISSIDELTNIGTGGYEPAEDHSLERECFVEGAVWQSKQYDIYQGSFRHIPGNYLDCIDEVCE